MLLLHFQSQTQSSVFIVSNSQQQNRNLKNTIPKLKPPPTQSDSGLIFRQKLNYLTSLNINTQKALTLNPTLRTAPLSTLTSTEDSLASLGLTRPAIGRILDMHPHLLTTPPHTITPLLNFLTTTVKLPNSHIPIAISRCPRLLVTDVESHLKPAFRFLTSIGLRVTSRTTMLLVSNVEGTLLRKIEFLMGLGLSYEEVCRMCVRCPGLLTFSVEQNFVPKVEFLVREMGGGVEDVRRFPQYFAFSLEGRIRPRLRVLRECGVWMGLEEMLMVSDGEFRARVVDLRLKAVDERG